MPTTSHHHFHVPHFRSHLVQQSFTKRAAKFFCSIFLSFLFFVGIVLFIIWLALRPHRPRFHVADFSASGLEDATALAFTFNVTIRNPNKEIGIHFDSFNAAVFYRDERVGVAADVAGPFYEPPKNTTSISGLAVGEAAPLTAAGIVNDLKGGSTEFRLELTSVFRFRLSRWDTHHHMMHVSCDVAVGTDGHVLNESKEKRCLIYFL